jgi:glycosyltransferase involved in cell wall biosynthesis
LRPTRIALVSPGWPRAAFANGIVSYVDSLVRGFAAHGAEARVLSYRTERGGEDATLIRGALERTSTPAKFAVKTLWKLLPKAAAVPVSTLDTVTAFRNLNRDFRFEVAEIEETHGIARWVARAFRAPVVIRLHGPWFLNGSALGVPDDAEFRRRVRNEGVAIRQASGVTAPSRDVLDQVRAYYRLALPDAAVIPNPGPEPDPAFTWRPELAEPGSILYVGRFDRHKGADLMVQAFARLCERRPGLKLKLAGKDAGFIDDAGKSWSFSEYVAKHVPDALRPSIELLGQVDPVRLSEHRQRASVVVCASRYENFGVALLEALSQGCPLVSSDAGGCPEIGEHERSALLFPSGDVNALRDRIARMLDDRELAERLARQALLDYRAKFMPNDIARTTLDFYASVLDRARSKSRRSATRGEAGLTP